MSVETKEVTHTPGPWKVWREWPDRDPDIPRRFHIHTGDASNPADPEYRRIATTTDMPEHVAEANARLIAAAPEQNEALKAVTRELKHYLAWRNGEAMEPQREKAENALRLARTAIAKAEGGS